MSCVPLSELLPPSDGLWSGLLFVAITGFPFLVRGGRSAKSALTAYRERSTISRKKEGAAACFAAVARAGAPQGNEEQDAGGEGAAGEAGPNGGRGKLEKKQTSREAQAQKAADRDAARHRRAGRDCGRSARLPTGALRRCTRCACPPVTTARAAASRSARHRAALLVVSGDRAWRSD